MADTLLSKSCLYKGLKWLLFPTSPLLPGYETHDLVQDG